MIFIFGGAYNGKKSWVIENLTLPHNDYNIIDFDEMINQHINGIDIEEYCNRILESRNTSQSDKNILIVENIQNAVKLEAKLPSCKKAIDQLLNWEMEKENRIVIVVGDEIGLSIVPIDKTLREWRDNVGLLYKYVVEKACCVYRVWFGIGEKLK